MEIDCRAIITQEPGKRGGRPCIRGMRIAVADILGWLAAGMPEDEILADYPELTGQDIRAALAYAARSPTFFRIRSRRRDSDSRMPTMQRSGPLPVAKG